MTWSAENFIEIINVISNSNLINFSRLLKVIARNNHCSINWIQICNMIILSIEQFWEYRHILKQNEKFNKFLYIYTHFQ